LKYIAYNNKLAFILLYWCN